MKKNDIDSGKYDNFLIPNMNKILFCNKFKMEHFRVVGIKRRLRKIGEYSGKNGISNVGKNLLLNAMFNDATQIANSAWVIGLIDNASFSALAAADTMASHSGWIESTAYSESTRVAWGSGTATAQSTTNASPATFTINATATLNGIFITSNNTKGGTTGTLWATGSYTSTVPVASGDLIKNSYSVSC